MKLKVSATYLYRFLDVVGYFISSYVTTWLIFLNKNVLDEEPNFDYSSMMIFFSVNLIVYFIVFFEREIKQKLSLVNLAIISLSSSFLLVGHSMIFMMVYGTVQEVNSLRLVGWSIIFFIPCFISFTVACCFRLLEEIISLIIERKENHMR